MARAYRRLSEEGLVSIRRGRGVVVRIRKDVGRFPHARERVEQTLRDALTAAHPGGLSLGEVRKLFREQAAVLPFRKART